MTNNEHVRDFLNYYCALPTEPQYAVLLSGLWGSGKTWFIKDFVARSLTKPERVLYLSLYGVQSFEDIESELFRLLHPVLASKPARFLHRLARGVLKTTINFDLNGDGKPDGSVSGGIPSERVLERVTLDAERILIIDDLERCPIPVTDLLGYVNQFVEHGGLKAILIANEQELLKSTASDNAIFDSEYARIKEKLVGRTFEIIPEVSSALAHFASDLPTPRAREIVKNNFAVITQVYECSKYKNLRLVRHSLWDFDRLSLSIDSTALALDPLLTDLLALFLAYSLEVRSGTVQPNEIQRLHNGWLSLLKARKNEPNPDQPFHDVWAKYATLNLYDSLVSVDVWQSIFATGSIPQEELNVSLLRSKYFHSENQPNWVKLWYGTNLSDEVFKKVLSAVDSEWSSHSFRKLGEVIHVTGMLLRYAKNAIYQKSATEVISSAKFYIDKLIADGDLTPIRPNSRESAFANEAFDGLGFHSKEESEFIEFLAYVQKRRQDAAKDDLPSQAEILLTLIDSDTSLFTRRLTLTNDSENIYYQTPILNFIDAGKFVDRFLETKPENWSEIAYALERRYGFANFNEALIPELPWLEQVAAKLEKQVIERTGRVSSLSIKTLLEQHIRPAIDKLKVVSISSASAT